MVHFVGAGSGAPDLITVRGQRLLSEADVIIYAGSLVNPALLESAKQSCEIYNSAKMTLDEVINVMQQAEADRKSKDRCKIREVDNTCDKREEITCTSYRNKSDPARKLHLDAVPEL